MSDATTYAQRARTALAEAATATLLVHGLGRCDRPPAAVVLHEHDGRPRLICPPDSALSAAARAARPALLSVDSQPDGMVLFAGTLVLEETQQIDGNAVDVVGLRLSSVLLELDCDPGPVVQYHLPLDVYFACATDIVAQYAARVLAHTNDAHRHLVRRYIARCTDVSDTSIADARVVALDADGVLLEWVDEDGGHTVWVAFPARVATSAQLALALRDQLSH